VTIGISLRSLTSEIGVPLQGYRTTLSVWSYV